MEFGYDSYNQSALHQGNQARGAEATRWDQAWDLKWRADKISAHGPSGHKAVKAKKQCDVSVSPNYYDFATAAVAGTGLGLGAAQHRR